MDERTSCNFTKAIVSLPNGQSIEGPLVWWERFGNDQLIVKIDGRIYLAHSENVILIGE